MIMQTPTAMEIEIMRSMQEHDAYKCLTEEVMFALYAETGDPCPLTTGSYADVLEWRNAVLEKYRNDAMFHAKVRCLVNAVMRHAERFIANRESR